MEWIVPLVATILTASTPLLFAALGELVCERSGVLNLGVEGMMIVGAVCAFAATLATGSVVIGFMAGAVGGLALSALFAVMVLWFRTSQVPTGLALTLFGTGLSALVGTDLIGASLKAIDKGIPVLQDIPYIGQLFFGHDWMVYVAILATIATAWFLFRTRAGLVIRAVGEDHDAAHALGYPVLLVRLGAILFGGMMAGLAGGYLSLIYTPLWAENMTTGRGWIALALVVFATWRPWWCLMGAYIFGSFTILQFYLQGSIINISSQYLAMLPYLVTIIVLVWASGRSKSYLGAPACIGKPFITE